MTGTGGHNQPRRQPGGGGAPPSKGLNPQAYLEKVTEEPLTTAGPSPGAGVTVKSKAKGETLAMGQMAKQGKSCKD